MASSQDSRINNFDFLRISAALFVLVSHQYILSGLPAPIVFGNQGLGRLGVLIFFSISGFLVSQSWRQDPHILRFAAKRFLRIWPGLAVVTLLSAVVLGPFVSSLLWQDYFFKPEFLDFLSNLKLMSIRYFLPGVFENNIYPKAVNGSLWTIPIELRWYFILLLIGLVGLLNKPRLVLFGVVLFGVYYFVFDRLSANDQYLLGLFFLSGVCLDLFREIWQPKPLLLLAAASAASLSLYLSNKYEIALLFLVPSFAIYIGCQSTPILKRWGTFGDISFGIYIYAFPVQQTIWWAFGKNLPFAYGLFLVTIVTVVLSFASWHLIEHPALSLKRHLRRP